VRVAKPQIQITIYELQILVTKKYIYGKTCVGDSIEICFNNNFFPASLWFLGKNCEDNAYAEVPRNVKPISILEFDRQRIKRMMATGLTSHEENFNLDLLVFKSS
jgi:hypothetical protein